MTTTLQEAMLKAGLISKEKLKKAETEKKQAARPQHRPEKRSEEPPPKKAAGFIEGKHHHHARTDCEACGKSSPDVEYYEHKNKSFDKYWLCVRCADSHSIPDQTRQTMQSSHAKIKLFRREYGATKVFK